MTATADFIAIRMQLQGIEKAIANMKALQEQGQRLQQSMRRSAPSDDAARGLSRLGDAAAAATAAYAGLYSTIRTVNQALNAQQQRFSFRNTLDTMYGEQQRRAIEAGVRANAQRTGTLVGVNMEAAKMLSTVPGMKAEEIVPLLSRFQNIALASGTTRREDLVEVMRQFAQVGGTGTVQGQELDVMVERVPLLAKMLEQFGTSVGAIKQMTPGERLTFHDLKAMIMEFGGREDVVKGAEKASTQLSGGSLNRLIDTFTDKVLIPIADELTPAIKKAANALADWIEKNEELAVNLMKAAGYVAAFVALGGGIKALKLGLEGLLVPFKAYKDILAKQAAKGAAATAAGAAAEVAADAAGSAVGSASAGKAASKGAGEAAEAVVEKAAKEAASDAAGAAAGGAAGGAAATRMGAIVNSLKTALKALVPSAGTLGRFGLASGAISLGSAATIFGLKSAYEYTGWDEALEGQDRAEGMRRAALRPRSWAYAEMYGNPALTPEEYLERTAPASETERYFDLMRLQEFLRETKSNYRSVGAGTSEIEQQLARVARLLEDLLKAQHGRRRSSRDDAFYDVMSRAF